MDIIQYGVFKLGQIWTVTDNAGRRLGFPTRAAAVAAVRTMAAGHRAARRVVLVSVQSETGALRTVLNPVDELSPSTIANDDAWDVLLDTAHLRRARSHAGVTPSNDA